MIFLEELKQQLPQNYSFLEMVLDIYNLDLVNRYYLFLKENNETYGLFSKADSLRIASRHVYESMVYIYYLYSNLRVSRETSFLDVGTGPGLPGFLLYCLKETPKITLLDSSQRRLKILENFIRDMGYKDIKIVYKRVEEWYQRYDICLTRALIPFPFSAVLMSHVFEKYIAIFSANLPTEPFVDDYLKRYNLKIVKVYSVPELEFLGERQLILLSHINKQKKMKPINWKTLRREMDEYYNSNSQSKGWSRKNNFDN